MPECGPLRYIPGSHKIPYYEFEADRIAIRHGKEEYLKAYEFTMDQCEERGLKEKVLTCQRGDVLIWHASLVHGGAAVTAPDTSRCSFVVHFSTLGNYKMRWAACDMPSSEGSVTISRRTDRRLSQYGVVGLDNPLRGLTPRFLPLWRGIGWLKRMRRSLGS